MKTLVSLSSLALTTFVFACSGQIDPTETPSATEGELVTTTMQDIQLSDSPGYVAFDKDPCTLDQGQWALDFSTRRLSGEGCVAGTPIKASRVLSLSDVELVRKALRLVRPVATPASCPTDGPTTALIVHRISKPNVKLAEEKFIDEQNSCFAAPYVAAKNLPEVAAVLAKLAAVGSLPSKCGGPSQLACAAGSKCLRNGAYPDAFGTCEVDSGIVCDAIALCDPKTSFVVSSCAPRASCYYTSICGQEFLCQNK